MILQALTRYYDILRKDDESNIAPPGYSSIAVSFALNISQDGDLKDIFPLATEQNGRKVPQRMIVPEQVNHTNQVSAFFLCDNSAYVLGISERDDATYGIRRFEAFRQFNKEMLGKANCETARAVIAFLDKYDPATAKEKPLIANNITDLLDGNNRFVFKLQGKEDYAHNDPTILEVWESYKAGSDFVLGQCLVTGGEEVPIARLLPSLQGVRGAPATGVKLVSFNERAYESYNRVEGQGLNSPVSEKTAFAYTKVLNYLLSDMNENKKFFVGDTTVVYWAESHRKEYAKAFMGLCEPEVVEIPIKDEPAKTDNSPTKSKKINKRMKDVAEKVKRVQRLDEKKLLEGLEDENPRFYILGLSPNKARAAVRFFHGDLFDRVVKKIMQHYEDLKIDKEFDDQPDHITIYHVLNETASKKITDKERQKNTALLSGSTFRAILENTPYPAALYNAVMIRIHADVDSEDKKKKEKTYKINYVRAAIVKAYLLRKYRKQPNNSIKETLKMSLNVEATNPAYVLGRLFAILEKAQLDAAKPIKLDSTIKDRYFSSACASPASVFPVLLRLSQHHTSKGKYGRYFDKLIGEILNLLDVKNNPFPAHLTLDEQGVFVLGYYHQRVFRNTDDSAESNSSEIN
jgi:CRISPR-associated protein Csd1